MRLKAKCSFKVTTGDVQAAVGQSRDDFSPPPQQIGVFTCQISFLLSLSNFIEHRRFFWGNKAHTNLKRRREKIPISCQNIVSSDHSWCRILSKWADLCGRDPLQHFPSMAAVTLFITTSSKIIKNSSTSDISFSAESKYKSARQGSHFSIF